LKSLELYSFRIYTESRRKYILRNYIRFFSCCIVFLSLSLALTACSSPSATTGTTPAVSSTAPGPEETAIRAWADPVTVTTLQGLSEGSLGKYTQNASAQFKAALAPDTFSKTVAQLNTQLGAFQSVTFLRIEKQGVYIIVHYKAKYAKSDVGIRMVFDQDHLVAGQWFE
jgi:hypothetical protein